MKRIVFLVLLFTGISLNILAQCGGTILTVLNPSFEGTPQPHITPPLWDICMPGCTPDTQPGSWGITLPAYNGGSYVGFADNAMTAWHEGAGQTLSSPMVAGTTYNFTIALATTASTGGGITPGCIEMQIWGGNSACAQTELLWSSGDIFNPAHMDAWVLHTVSFTPTQNWTHLLFLDHNLGCTNVPYIMLDDLSPIVPIADSANFSWTNSGGTAIECLGQTISFHDLSTSPQSTIAHWLWNFNDGTPNSILQNPTHIYANPGTYNVSLIITTAVPCTDTAIFTLVVHALPTVTVSGGGPICLGSNSTVPVTFTFTGSPPWNLTYTDGTTPTTVNGILTSPYTINVGTAGTYAATAISDTNCTGTFSGSATVIVNNLPNVSYAPPPSVCVNIPSFPLTGATPSGGTYSGAGVNSNVFDPATAGVGNHIITYIYTDPVTGCTDSAQQTLIVNMDMAVGITPASGFICPGGSVSLTSTAGDVIRWTPVAGLSDTNTSLVTASPAVTTTYTVIITSAAGCTGSSTVTVTVYNNSAIHFSTLPPDGCEPLHVNFNYNPGPDILDSSWIWSFGDIYSDTVYSTLKDPSHFYSTAGDYNVILSVTTVDGCLGADTVPIHVYPIPVANFIMHPDIASMDDPAINFVNQSTLDSYWYWTFNDPASGNHNWSILEDPIHVFTDSGTYHIMLVVQSEHGCLDTVSKVITIYPDLLVFIPNAFTPNGNGVNDQFIPQISGIFDGTFNMSIFDRWGKEMYTTSDLGSGWDGRSGDGKVCPAGIFSWIIHFTDTRGKEYKMLGHVAVIR